MSNFGRNSMHWEGDDDDDWDASETTNKPFEGVGTSISQRSISFHSGIPSSQSVVAAINSPQKPSESKSQYPNVQTEATISQVQFPPPQKQVPNSTATTATTTPVSNCQPSVTASQKPNISKNPYIPPQKQVNFVQNQSLIPPKQTQPQTLYSLPQKQSPSQIQPSQSLVGSKSQTFLKSVEQTMTNNSSTTKTFDKPLPQHRQSSPSLLLHKTPNSQIQTATTTTTTGIYQLKSQQQTLNQNSQSTKTQLPSSSSSSSFSQQQKNINQTVQPSKLQNRTHPVPENVSIPSQQLKHAMSTSNINTDGPKNPLLGTQPSKGISFGDRLRAQQLGGSDQIPRRPSITEPETTTTTRRNSGTDENSSQIQSRSQIIQPLNPKDHIAKQQELTHPAGSKTIEELEKDPESIKAVAKIIEQASELDLAKQRSESESLTKLKSIMSTLFYPESSDFKNLPVEAKILVEKILSLNRC